MNARTKNSVHALVIIITVVVVMTIARQGFAWTNPAGAPPFSASSIMTLGGNIGIGVSPISKLQSAGTITVGSGAGAGTVGNMQLTTGGASPISNRLTFGTDGTGWKFAIGENQGGTISDFLTVQDNGAVSIGTTAADSNYKLTTSGGGVKAESGSTQPAGYFNNTGGGAAITVGTGGITLGGVNQTAWPVASATSWPAVTNKSLGDTARSDSTLDIGVSQYMRWKNYGNGHVIIDASNGTAPNGTAINNANSQVAWSGTYPTLMGWNGANTYGVRVDSARVADSATDSSKVAKTGDTMSGNLGFSNVGIGSIGVYDPTKTQAIWSMGPAYVLPAGGGTTNYGTLYGLGWSYEPDYGGVGNNPQSKAGLSHQLLIMHAGVTRTAIGTGIWTSGNLSFGSANPTISASSYFIAPGGAYFNSGTVYTEAAIQARGGLHNDSGAYLALQGGTTGKTQLSGAMVFPDGTEQSTAAKPFRGVLAFTSIPWPQLEAGTRTTIPYGFERFDTDNMHDTVTNPQRFTVPAGVKKVRLTVHLGVGSVPTTAGYLFVQVKKNGSTNNYDSVEESYPLDTIHRPSMIMTSPPTEVIAGDYFTVDVTNSVGILTGVMSWFSMEVIE